MKQPVERVENTMGMDESLGLHRVGWVVQRIGWILFLVFIGLALFGLFGTGLLSDQKKEDSGNMVQYERYGRYENSTSMHFVANSENGQARLYIPQEYLKIFEVEQITPAPHKQQAVNDDIEYTFLANAPVHILFRGMPKKTGNVQATVRINNTPFVLSQYIFP